MAGLVFDKGICIFISCNLAYNSIKWEDVGLRVTDDIRRDFEDVSLEW